MYKPRATQNLPALKYGATAMTPNWLWLTGTATFIARVAGLNQTSEIPGMQPLMRSTMSFDPVALTTRLLAAPRHVNHLLLAVRRLSPDDKAAARAEAVHVQAAGQLPGVEVAQVEAAACAGRRERCWAWRR